MESESNDQPRRVRRPVKGGPRKRVRVRRPSESPRPESEGRAKSSQSAASHKRPAPAKRRISQQPPRPGGPPKSRLKSENTSPRKTRQPDKPKSSGRPTRLEAAPAWLAVARGLALFLGSFALLTVFGELRNGGFDANFGWIDLRPCPPDAARGILGLSGIGLVLFGLFPNMPDLIRSIGILATMAVLAVAVANAIQFGRMRREGTVVADNDLSHSIHLVVALTVCVFGLCARPRLSVYPFQNLMLMTVAFVVGAATLPLTMFACSEKTNVNYQPEFVAVVGPTSVSPTDQIKAGLKLLQNDSDRLVISGVVHEKANALRQQLAPLGRNTVVDAESRSLESSVQFAASEAIKIGAEKVAVVCDFHQLPRARKLFRKYGFDAVPVPVGSFDSIPMVEQKVMTETIAYYRSYVDNLLR